MTTFPHDYYPGTEWKSAMLWGAAEIALADEALHAPAARLRADLAVAAHWAEAYIAQGHPVGGDTLNLYDNGAVGEAELLQAMQQAHSRPVIAPHALLADMAAQLRVGEHWAKGDPFGLGTARPGRRLAARVRAGRHQRALPALWRVRRLPGVRPAADELRPRRQRLGEFVGGRRGRRVPALHAERDRQPGRARSPAMGTSSWAPPPTGRAASATSSASARSRA